MKRIKGKFPILGLDPLAPPNHRDICWKYVLDTDDSKKIMNFSNISKHRVCVYNSFDQ